MKLLLALGAVLAVGILAAQAKPNFSGTWTQIRSSAAPPPGAAAKPVVVVLTQTDKAITLKTEGRSFEWPLDGSETTVQNPGPDGTVEMKVRARFEAGRLRVEQRSTTNLIVTTVSLSDDGTELTVEIVVQTPEREHRETQVFKKS
jgi:hypothetical protein